jgi:hypothetical protein
VAFWCPPDRSGAGLQAEVNVVERARLGAEDIAEAKPEGVAPDCRAHDHAKALVIGTRRTVGERECQVRLQDGRARRVSAMRYPGPGRYPVAAAVTALPGAIAGGASQSASQARSTG